MNPSAVNWIPKYLHILKKNTEEVNLTNSERLYDALKQTGFIYGVSLDTIPKEFSSTYKLTREEFTKVNLFHALMFTYRYEKNKEMPNPAIKSIINFYDAMDKGRTGFLKKLTLSPSYSQKLEKILAARLQETNTFLNRGVTGILTYALLYVDVLAYKYALQQPDSFRKYAEQVEITVITACYLALNSKKKKNKYDKLLIELFQSSAHYLSEKSPSNTVTIETLPLLKQASILEKRYILDICTITVWDDHSMDEEEFSFLKELTEYLDLPDDYLSNSLAQLALFMSKHKTSVKLFEYANPVKLFYKQSTATVKLLILRNKKRLQKELEESGELLVLLTKSTSRELSHEEKTKVKQQLLDICKTIPSLTIFLLPGGTVLLPILIKFIPRLLPSSFRENRIDNN
ncbi:MAG: LETM1 domain-containing protein [Bacteroidia bacterium]|nr:LETM1 domain-containing protein [Bacteroidia bacterium]NNF30892.1 hypothetical protein [Flavobacteriaceae bacterium]MBT8275402.1 LETM1 domain-containing protein [Bacteroidia bacterium]NNJ82091.1 hypothetical protein [Flavobacteriaceae bacterium]NNK54505.1 hypothetical protein [Flavobacteriaceae bacterium]